jgi:hypothetical protein
MCRAFRTIPDPFPRLEIVLRHPHRAFSDVSFLLCGAQYHSVHSDREDEMRESWGWSARGCKRRTRPVSPTVPTRAIPAHDALLAVTR